MNDFTKDELNRLLLRSFLWVGYPENQNEYERELVNKIQSLIDNHCEHDKLEKNICYKCGWCAS